MPDAERQRLELRLWQLLWIKAFRMFYAEMQEDRKFDARR